MEAVKVDGGQNVGDSHNGNIEVGKQFHFTTGNVRINMQFSGDSYEILLQHLERYNATTCTPVLCQKIQGPSLLVRGSPVVSVDQNIGIEEATSDHESDCDRSASRANYRGRTAV